MSSAEPNFDYPALAGLCSIERAAQGNWSVEQSVSVLKRLHYALKRSTEILASNVTGEPIYELKTLYCHHAYICAEQVQSIRKRVSEMREPPLGLEEVPCELLKYCFDEIENCPTAGYLLRGIYGAAIPAILQCSRHLKESAHPLADAPTVRLTKLCEFELAELAAIGEKAVNVNWVADDDLQQLVCWAGCLETHLSNALSRPFEQGLEESEQSQFELPAPVFSGQAAVYQGKPARDSRFQDPYNAGVNPEAFLYDENFSARDKTLMMYYKRLREIDVPEMMASILFELRDKEPWEFHYEMTRQLWDEARHAMMGEVGFHALGLDWTQIPINWTWSLNLNEQLNARERHGVLFFIEQGLMPKTGKRYEWEIAKQSDDRLSALFQDFDWADEVLHAQIGRRWYVTRFDSLRAAMDYGDRCWSQVMSHWQEYKDQGLTEHRNWWPELYAKACDHWGVEPDPKAASFNVSYVDLRADLKDICKDGSEAKENLQ